MKRYANLSQETVRTLGAIPLPRCNSHGFRPWHESSEDSPGASFRPASDIGRRVINAICADLSKGTLADAIAPLPRALPAACYENPVIAKGLPASLATLRVEGPRAWTSAEFAPLRSRGQSSYSVLTPWSKQHENPYRSSGRYGGPFIGA